METTKIINRIIDTTIEDEDDNGIIVDLVVGVEMGVIRNKVLRISRFQDFHFKEEIFIVIDDL